MQPPDVNPTTPQPAVMGSVAQPQPQHQPYGQPQMVGQPVVMQQMPGTVVMGGGYPQTSAQTAMILSIVSIFVGGICLAIPALIIANGALAITNQMPGHPDAGSAKIAQVISWIVIGLTLLVIGFVVMVIAGAGASGEF